MYTHIGLYACMCMCVYVYSVTGRITLDFVVLNWASLNQVNFNMKKRKPQIPGIKGIEQEKFCNVIALVIPNR